MDKLDLKITNQNKHIQQTPEVQSRYSPEQKRKLAKASEDFESMMTSMMLKSMTQANGGLFGDDNYGGDMLDTLFESELAGYISKNKSMGISQMIYRKMTGEELKPEDLLPLRDKASDKIELKNVDKELPKITPSKSALQRLEKYEDIINDASEKYGVDTNIIKSIILTESAANERALSKTKAKGLMQLMDGTAKDMGVKNSWDARENIFGGTKYFAQMLRQYNGNTKLALAAYNAGPGNVNKYNGIPPFEETKNYVTRVLGYLNKMESEDGNSKLV
ncbi:MAG: transglycosylase SLT domain-containing protein [bacterium]